MTSASIVFSVYLLLSTLLVGADTMNRPQCFNQTDKLYAIDGYANYLKSNDSYYNFVKSKQECIFNNTAWIHLSTINVTNVSNGTFVPEFDRYKLKIAIDTQGRFK